ncbi:FAD/NAD(P)-binding protein [Fervidicoccus fontis]|jgi:NAD(P)H-flavin reductase|uniref:Sulfhydrogenase subunit gamma n=2 Tax=Fervidicoccus fontis TaxID=683846 RepID=I0A1Z8_FERFK|nr:FAD/NAD(P)-binding protein [Fervidicoccus fontis]AFH43005.1 Sulfhydrogenase subunit gamma [Fervidicoccus fontis Kam940]MBE9391441.1 FAD/NAD(P)-binding protein [Fervidicoccus fontis]
MVRNDILVPSIANVKEIINETSDIKTYKLFSNAEKAQKFKPGQFVMVYLKGFGEVPISLSDLVYEEDGGSLITLTIRGTGTVTKYMLSTVNIGDKIGIRGPYGNNWPIEEALGKDILIAGGGIGFAPLRPVLRFVSNNRQKFGRLVVIYGARSPNDIIYKYEIEEYKKIPGIELFLTIDKPAEDWKWNVGFVPDMLDKVKLDGDFKYFVCGPEIMMKITAKKLVNKGADPRDIFVSLERRMRCGVGICGTCQLGHYYVCKDGPVFSFDQVSQYMEVEGI